MSDKMPIINIFIGQPENKEVKRPNPLSKMLRKMHSEKMGLLEELKAKTAPSSGAGGG